MSPQNVTMVVHVQYSISKLSWLLEQTPMVRNGALHCDLAKLRLPLASKYNITATGDGITCFWETSKHRTLWFEISGVFRDSNEEIIPAMRQIEIERIWMEEIEGHGHLTARLRYRSPGPSSRRSSRVPATALGLSKSSPARIEGSPMENPSYDWTIQQPSKPKPSHCRYECVQTLSAHREKSSRSPHASQVSSSDEFSRTESPCPRSRSPISLSNAFSLRGRSPSSRVQSSEQPLDDDQILPFSNHRILDSDTRIGSPSPCQRRSSSFTHRTRSLSPPQTNIFPPSCEDSSQLLAKGEKLIAFLLQCEWAVPDYSSSRSMLLTPDVLFSEALAIPDDVQMVSESLSLG